ncbi:MAG TPA: hypothetical protein VFZ89_15470 [Solirubrobacteraceae bacterium]
MLRRLEVPTLAALGATQLALAAWMVLFPHSFHDSLGSFGTFNVHFINDAATMNAGIGALLLCAARWEALRPGALFGGAFFFGFHAINHWVDVNDANGDLFVGLFDAISLTGLAATCAVYYRLRQQPSGPAS